MSQAELFLKKRGWGQTARTDLWWLQPLAIFLGLSAFIVYSTWAAFQGANYYLDGYLSPMYSPEIFGDSPHSVFGPQPAWWPGFLPFSPAFLILWAPAGFRLTCYYYRGSYYKAFWADPPNCSVGEPRNAYRGEQKFPLIIQNIHRYFLYIAVVFIFLLAHDAWKALWFTDAASGEISFGLGVGTLVLTLNVILLGGYTFGCHSLRHLVGGKLNSMAGKPVRRNCYDCVSGLNRKHMVFAWCSLFWVGFTDFYIRMCSMGVWTDWRIL